jgi:hypothetical protein
MGRVSVAALALCLLLSGCSTLSPNPEPRPGTTTATPAPVPTAGPDGTLAPGLTREGVVDARTLAVAHVARLADRSYTLTATRTTRYPNGTLRERLELNLSLGADRSYLAHAETAGPRAPVFLGRPPASAAFWSNGSVYTRRLTHAGSTTYTTFQPTNGAGTWQYWARTVPFGGRGGNPRGFLTRTFTAIPTRTTGRAVDSGPTTYTVVGTRATATIELGVEDPREVDLRAEVTADGLVRSLTLTYVGTVDGRTVEVTRRLRYDRVGATDVTRPPWVDRALSE